PLLATFLLLGARRAIAARARIPPEIAIAAAAYVVWAALGQNTVDKPRHWLPLGPLVIVVLAVGAEAVGGGPHPQEKKSHHGGTETRRFLLFFSVSPCLRGEITAAILAVQWFTDGVSLAAAHREPSPAAALVDFAAAQAGVDEWPILTRDLGR